MVILVPAFSAVHDDDDTWNAGRIDVTPAGANALQLPTSAKAATVIGKNFMVSVVA